MKSPGCCSVLAMNNLPHGLAEALAARAGLGIPKTLEPLAGGRNNRVFRVDFKGGEVAVLKSYYHDPRDPRDRLHAEWSFLNYVAARGVRNVPRPLAIDAVTHSALYSFIIGERPKKSMPASLGRLPNLPWRSTGLRTRRKVSSRHQKPAFRSPVT